MSLFYNPQESGSGVSKQESEMKPFFKFWALFGRKFWYLAALNMFYIVMCVPVITIGPATAALTHVMRKFVLEQPIFVFGEFLSAFKKHFKARTVLMGVVSPVLFAAFIFSMSYYTILVGDYPDVQNYFLMAMCIVSGAVFLTMNLYIYPQLTYLDLKMNAIIKNSLIFCAVGLKRNVITLSVYVAVILLFWFARPFSLIFLPLAPFSQLAFLSVFNAHPSIKKYIIDPFYEAKSEKNPEIPDYIPDSQSAAEDGHSEAVTAPIFTDLGGKEAPINKKTVKTTGKVIK